MGGRSLSELYEGGKECCEGGGQLGQEIIETKEIEARPFLGVLTHEVGDGRVDEECTRMRRRDKYNANPGGVVNRSDGNRDTAGMREVENRR